MKKFFLLSAIILFGTSLFADQNDMPVYKSGPTVTLFSQGGVVAGGYYFGPNNCISTDFWVVPYEATKSTSLNNRLDSNQTSFGLDLFCHIPIKKQTFNNKFFLSVGLGWGQFFGTEDNVKIDYKWGIWPEVGFEYRLNEQVYFGVEADAYSYIETKFNNIPGRRVEQSIFQWGTMYVTYKF